MPLLGSPFFIMQHSVCALWSGDLQCLSGIADDHRYLMNGKDPARIQTITSLISFLSALWHRGAAKKAREKLFTFCFRYIHLIPAHQKNLLITGLSRHGKRHLRYHVSQLMVLKFLGDALTVIRNYQITQKHLYQCMKGLYNRIASLCGP